MENIIIYTSLNPTSLKESNIDKLVTKHQKTRLYSFDPFKPNFYTVKLGFTGVSINFLVSAQKHRMWVLVSTASPRRF